MERRAKESLKVTLLGTGRPTPQIDRFGASTLVEAGTTTLLFDCGRGAAQRLNQLEVPFAEVHELFLTHLHSDHVVGIPDLWLTGWILGRKVPFSVLGPAGTKEMMFHLEQAYHFDIHIRRDRHERLPALGVTVIAKDIEGGVVYQNSDVKVTAFKVDHVEPAFGYRIDFAGRSVVLSGDTGPSENLIRFSQGADVLILNVIVPDAFGAQARFLTPEQVEKIIPLHTTPEQAGEIFTRARPKLAVYTHVSPGFTPDLIPLTRTTYSGPLEVGEDLMTIEVGQKVQVRRFSARDF